MRQRHHRQRRDGVVGLRVSDGYFFFLFLCCCCCCYPVGRAFAPIATKRLDNGQHWGRSEWTRLESSFSTSTATRLDIPQGPGRKDDDHDDDEANLRLLLHHQQQQQRTLLGGRGTTTTVNNNNDVTANTNNNANAAYPTSYNDSPNDQRYSAGDWFHNIKSLPRSTVLRSTRGPVLATVAWATLWTSLHAYCRQCVRSSTTSGIGNTCARWAAITLGGGSPVPHAATVTALGLLLVFRTNSAYQKFNEGRSIWEHVLSVSRTLTRLWYLYEDDVTPERRERLARLLAAFPYLLHAHVVMPARSSGVRRQQRFWQRLAPNESSPSSSSSSIRRHRRSSPKDGGSQKKKRRQRQRTTTTITAATNAVVSPMSGSTVLLYDNSDEDAHPKSNSLTTWMQRVTQPKRQSVLQPHTSFTNATATTKARATAAATTIVPPTTATLSDYATPSPVPDLTTLPWSLFTEPTLTLCYQATNRPLWICDRLGQEIAQIPYSDNYTNREREKFLSAVASLSTAVGECERLHQTAVPLNFARHSLRSLTLWLFTLPGLLVETYTWYTPPVMGLMAWLLYGIYQIGYSIEDPFQGSLRLSTLCNGIYRDVLCDARRVTAFGLATQENDNWRQLPI